MKKISTKIALDMPGNKRKVELLKLKIASGEYCVDPHNVAEKLIASGLFFNRHKITTLRGTRLF